SATTTSGRSRRRSRRRRAPRRSPTRRSATACRVCASTGRMCSRATRRRARRSPGRAQATGRRSSRPSPTAPRRMRPRTTRARTLTSNGSKRSGSASASGASRATCAAPASSTTTLRSRFAARRRTPCARVSRRPRRNPRPTSRFCSSTHTSIRPRRSAPTSKSCGGRLAELSIVEAINEAFHVELERDPSVMVIGEDVGRAGGVFRATAGLRDKFGPNRCFDTPLAEAGLLGSAVGLCMAGWRPVCEMQYDAFSYPCLDQLITHVGRYRWRTGGKMAFPLVVRMPYGGGVRAPELHDDSPEAYYVHTPGVKVAIPSTPADAKGLLAAAIRDPDPVVVLEPKLHYRTMRGEVPEGEHVVPLGQARTVREGDDLTFVAYGAMVPLAEAAADTLEASVEILDIRTLKPLDEDALLAAAAKTGRVVIVQEAPRTAGYGAELAAILAE